MNKVKRFIKEHKTEIMMSVTLAVAVSVGIRIGTNRTNRIYEDMIGENALDILRKSSGNVTSVPVGCGARLMDAHVGIDAIVGSVEDREIIGVIVASK